MPAVGMWLVAVLQLLLLAACGLCQYQGWQPWPLDVAGVRQVLAEAMRCQNLTQLHAAAVHAGREVSSFRLQLLPNGSVVDIGGASRRTLLAIASVSKGMFATVLPRIEERLRQEKGDATFDLLTTPIKQLLGDNNDFWFLDQVRTDSVTLQDLVSHTTGLRRHDALSIWSGFKSKPELARKTGRLNATYRYRGSFEYNNLVWTIADTVVERLINKNFSTYMREFLWQPLNMSDAVASSELDGRRLEVQYVSRPGRRGTPFERNELERSMNLMEAAGGIFLTLEDMVKYMQYHTRANISNYRLLQSVNAFVSSLLPLDPRILNDNITDLPDRDIESYGYGWIRSWYRDNLAYEHGGTYFDANCHLRVLTKRRLSVFAHASLGQTGGFQGAYPEILGSYIADLLLRNASFLNRDNVCRIFRQINPVDPVPVPRRVLTEADRVICTGSFGNYGFGTLTVYTNATSGFMMASYGTAQLEMTPVLLPDQPSENSYNFFLTILRPTGFPIAPAIVSANASHVMVHQPAQTPLTLRIWRQTTDGRVFMLSPALELDARLEKGLRPESWQRPAPCPGNRAAAASFSSVWLVAVVAAVSALTFSLQSC